MIKSQQSPYYLITTVVIDSDSDFKSISTKLLRLRYFNTDSVVVACTGSTYLDLTIGLGTSMTSES